MAQCVRQTNGTGAGGVSRRGMTSPSVHPKTSELHPSSPSSSWFSGFLCDQVSPLASRVPLHFVTSTAEVKELTASAEEVELDTAFVDAGMLGLLDLLDCSFLIFLACCP